MIGPDLSLNRAPPLKQSGGARIDPQKPSVSAQSGK